MGSGATGIGAAVSERDCIHGQLARSCGLCERDATIAALTKERDLALLSARQMKDAWHAACHDVGALQALVADGRAVVDDFMPYVSDCALQDYRRLNRFLVESEPPSGEPAPSKSQQKRIAAQSGETSAP